MKHDSTLLFSCFVFLLALFVSTNLTAQNGNCNTWTYNVKLGNAANNEKALDLLTLPDSSSIICGSSEGSSATTGLLIKLNNKGDLLWSKSFSQTQQDIVFKKIKFFPNGRAYVVGDAKNRASTATTPIILCIDLTGSIIWTKSLNNISLMKAIDFCNWDNSFSVLSSNNTSINVTMLDLNGQTVWSKTYNTKNAHTAIGIGSETNDIYVGYNETDSGYNKVVMVDLDLNGQFKFATKLGGKAENCNYAMQSMRMINLRPRVTALQVKNNIPSLVKINYSPSAQSEIKETFDFPQDGVSQLLNSAQNEWTEVIALSNGTNAQNIYLTSTYPDNFSTPISTKKLSFSSPVSISNIIRSNDGGSILAANTVGGNSGIIIVKTDSIFTLPGCGSEAVPSSFGYSNPPLQSETLSATLNALSVNNVSLVARDHSMNISVECKTLFCPVAIEPDSCLRTFSKEYRNSTNSMVVRKLFKMNNGNLLITGEARNTPYIAGGTSAASTITILDTLGRLVKSSVFNAEGISGFNYIIKLADGNFLIAGYSSVQANIFRRILIKFDENLNVIWKKIISVVPASNYINNIFESSEGDIFCSFRDNTSLFEEVRYLLKLNSTGQPVWFKKYNAGPNIFPGQLEYEGPLGESEDFIYLKYSEESSDQSPHIIKIRKSNGQVDWKKKFRINSSNNFTVVSLTGISGNLFVCGANVNRAAVFAINPQGQLLGSKIVNGDFTGRIAASNNRNNLLLSLTYGSYPNYAYGIVELDQQLRLQRQQFVQLPKTIYPSSIQPYSESVTYVAGNYYYPNPYWASVNITKYNFNSSFGNCELSNLTIPVIDMPITITDETTVMTDVSLPLVTDLNSVTFSSGDLAYDKYYCGSSSLCNTVQLTGTPVICDPNTTYTYLLKKSAGCTGSAIWQLDTLPRQVTVIAKTDTAIILKALRNGSFILHSKIFGSCKWLEDSINVAINILSPTLNLGQDTVLCIGNTIRLNAKSGFASYKWQDGSSDSIFIVNKPGTYFVQATTGCGSNTYSDTIIVNAAPPISFFVDPDTSKCNSDSVTLSAPAGFLNYSWSPQYNITSVSQQQVKVFPIRDTTYFIKAEKTPGCFAYDTINVKVNVSNAINLGTDTSFCNGDSIILDAGTGFISYLWSTGATTKQVIVKSAGRFSVVGYSAEGCRSYDTLSVVNTFTRPQVQLNKNPLLCEGTTRVLDAGTAVAASYLWNDGSRSRYLNIDSPGVYYVTVKDNHGCTGADTTTISRLVKVPSAFLPADTAVCQYERIEIMSLIPFRSFEWSTVSANSSIIVSAPGLYWLKGTDSNGCSGTDSIIVTPKQCMEGFFIPNAFTPNNDFKNDLFKPVIFGNVSNYTFTIYNRYGNIVFSTEDINKGWDGKYAGIPLDTGTYIWTCRFKLENQEVKMEKGTIILLR